MLRPFVLIFLAVLGDTASGQNLVPNPSFEEYTVCPSNIGQIDRSVGWTSLSGSTDYFNACAAGDSMGVPFNQMGYQDAASGIAYAGVANFVFGLPYYRENLISELETAMIPGTSYSLSMKVSPGGFGSDPVNSARWVSSGIGMRFSTIVLAPGIIQDNQASMWLPTLLDDTATWTTLSAVFVADSAYQYVILGCFWEDQSLDTALSDSTALLDGAYSFIDDVCVSPQPGYCDLWSSIGESSLPSWSVENQLVTHELVVVCNKGSDLPRDCSLRDTSGRLIRHLRMSTERMIIPMSDLPAGLYILMSPDISGNFPPISVVHINP